MEVAMMMGNNSQAPSACFVFQNMLGYAQTFDVTSYFKKLRFVISTSRPVTQRS